MRAGGGIVVDADGNSLIDLGSGIAVTTVGNRAPRVVDAVKAQVEDFTHTCFMVTPYESYVAVCRGAQPADPGRPRKAHGAVQLRRGSGRERRQDRPRPHRTQAVVAFDHAYHGRTNLTMALTAKNMPYKHGFGPFAPEVYRVPMSYPFRDAKQVDGELAAARAIDRLDKQVGADNVAAIVIEPIQGEGGFIVPARRVPARARRVVHASTASSSSPTRSRPASPAPARWFACDHEGVVPDLITTAKGIAGGLPLSAVTGPRPSHGRRARRRPRRHLRRQPGGLRGGAGDHRDHRGRRPGRRAAQIERLMKDRLHACRPTTTASATSAAAER